MSIWLTVTIKAAVVYGLAALLSASWFRHRPAWRAWLWLLVIYSFALLTLLEWPVGGAEGLRAWTRTWPADALWWGAHGYALISLVLLGLVVHRVVALSLIRQHAPLLGIEIESARIAAGQPLWRVLRRVRILRYGLLKVPIVFGILRPTLVLPDAVQGAVYRPLVRTAVLHGFVTTVRFDALWVLLARIVQSAYFMHPLVWRAMRRCTEARAIACDQWCAHLTSNPTELTSHLEAFSRQRGSAAEPFMALEVPLVGGAGRMHDRRLAALAGYVSSRKPDTIPPWPMALALLVWLGTLTLLTGLDVRWQAGQAGLVLHVRVILLGAALTGATALVVATAVVLAGRRIPRGEPADLPSSFSRETLSGCLQRMQTEWQSIRMVVRHGLEPLALAVVVLLVSGLLYAASAGWWGRGSIPVDLRPMDPSARDVLDRR